MCPGCLSLIHRMSIYTGTEHEFIRLSGGHVYVCVFTVKAPMVVLCLQFCVTTKVEGLSSNSFHILLKVYQHSCCCCSSPASYLHTGSIMQHHHPFTRMVLNALLSLFPSRTQLCCMVGICVLNGFLLWRLLFLASFK